MCAAVGPIFQVNFCCACIQQFQPLSDIGDPDVDPPIKKRLCLLLQNLQHLIRKARAIVQHFQP